jgi:hypothetical protein
MEATARGLPWQALLAPHAPCPHDARGFRRFVAWITGRACNAEAHTIADRTAGAAAGMGAWQEGKAFLLPIVRTTTALLMTLTLRRRLQFALEAAAVPGRPPKQRPSILDGVRLLRQQREAFQRFLSAWLAEAEKSGAAASADSVA